MTALSVLFLAAILGLVLVSARINTRTNQAKKSEMEKRQAAADDAWFADFRAAPTPDTARYGRLLQARELVTV